MMKKQFGFTLIELLIFVVLTAILAKTILFASQIALTKSPMIHNETIGVELANQCMEGFIGQRRLNGYIAPFNTTGPVASLPATCTTLTGFTVAASIAAGPTIAGDATYSTLTVEVTGLSSVTLTTLIANY
ncbi:MAG: type II secretion system protein [Gammaproteobacteria bacterium]|nr:type II secretion system protein [Gammaproteobacteria bacterium]